MALDTSNFIFPLGEFRAEYIGSSDLEADVLTMLTRAESLAPDDDLTQTNILNYYYWTHASNHMNLGRAVTQVRGYEENTFTPEQIRYATQRWATAKRNAPVDLIPEVGSSGYFEAVY